MTEEDKSFIKGFELSSGDSGGNPGVVDVGNGKINRIRPLHYDAKYGIDELGS